MDVISNPLIQIGALGAVILFVYLFMRHQSEIAVKELAARVKREEFIEGLVEKAGQSHEAHLTAWRDMTAETLAAYQAVNAAYDRLTQLVTETCTAVVNGHCERGAAEAALQKQVEQVHSALKALAAVVQSQNGQKA